MITAWADHTAEERQKLKMRKLHLGSDLTHPVVDNNKIKKETRLAQHPIIDYDHAKKEWRSKIIHPILLAAPQDRRVHCAKKLCGDDDNNESILGRSELHCPHSHACQSCNS